MIPSRPALTSLQRQINEIDSVIANHIDIVIRDAPMKFLKDHTPEEQEILRNVVCPGAKDGHIDYFLRVCETRRVEPFSGLLYLQVRTYKGELKASIAATIDGARAFAADAGDYAGSDEPEYDSEDEPKPKWCKVTVWKKVGNERYPFTAKCRFDEFKPLPPSDMMWNAKPYHMVSKVAEMQALRKGWPKALGESESGETLEESVQAPNAAAAALSRAPIRWINTVKAFDEYGVPEADVLTHVSRAGYTEVTEQDYEKLQSYYAELKRGTVSA